MVLGGRPVHMPLAGTPAATTRAHSSYQALSEHSLGPSAALNVEGPPFGIRCVRT